MASRKALAVSTIAALAVASAVVIGLQGIASNQAPAPLTPMQETRAAVDKPVAGQACERGLFGEHCELVGTITPPPAEVVSKDYNLLDKPVVNEEPTPPGSYPAPSHDDPVPLPKPKPRKVHAPHRKVLTSLTMKAAAPIHYVETGIAGVIEPLHIKSLWEVIAEWFREQMRRDAALKFYPVNANAN